MSHTLKAVLWLSVVVSALSFGVYFSGCGSDSGSDGGTGVTADQKALCEQECDKEATCTGYKFAKDFTTLDACKADCDPATKVADCKKTCDTITDATSKATCQKDCETVWDITACKSACSYDASTKTACEAKCDKEFSQACLDAESNAVSCAMGLSCAEIQGIFDKAGDMSATTCASAYQSEVTACGLSTSTGS